MDELDLAAKTLMRDDPVAFARLALGRRAPIRRARAVNVELPALARRVDTLLQVSLRGERREVRAHVEVAASWRSDLPRRVYEYGTLLRRGGVRVESVVLCLKPGRRQGPPSGRYVERGRTNSLTFRFPVVRLWEVGAEGLARMGLGLLPLVAYARDADPALIDRTMQRLSTVQPGGRRADLQAALAVFAGNVFRGIDWMGRIPAEVLVQNTFINAVRLQEQRRIVAKLLRARLGHAARPYVLRLEAASSRKVSRLLNLFAMSCPTEDELVTQLERLLPPA